MNLFKKYDNVEIIKSVRFVGRKAIVLEIIVDEDALCKQDESEKYNYKLDIDEYGKYERTLPESWLRFIS
jgi:hypothetical protein